MTALTGLDASFVYLETPETPMHVGSLHLYELPVGFRGSFAQSIRRHVAGRLHLAPVFTRRLAFMPLDLGHPQWAETAPDLRQHIRAVDGGPFTTQQVHARTAELHGQLMDRDRPLWEFHVFERVQPPPGLQVQGRLAALYAKIHHATLDGQAGTVLANALLDLSAVPRQVPPPARGRRAAPPPGTRQLIGDVFSSSLAQTLKAVRALPQAALAVGGAVARQVGLAGGSAPGATPAAAGRPRTPLKLAPHAPFNTGIGAGRVFASASLPFAEARALAREAGGSFNDLVLWLCATALRDWLKAHGGVPRQPLVAAMPVSLREAGNQDMTNQASMSLVQLGTQVADPARRMAAIVASSGRVKQALGGGLKSLLPTDYPSLLAPWLVGGVGRAALRTYGRQGVAARLPLLANLVISNVPGPQVPLYLAGAKMLTFHPLSIVMHGLTLNITLQTYAGRVDIGLVAGRDALDDLQPLADGLQAAFEQARQVFGKAAAPRTMPARKAA